MADNFKINVEITGDDSKFQKTAKSSEKAASDLEKKAGGDFAKIGSNLAGIFSDKATGTNLGGFIEKIGAGTTSLEALAGPAAIAAGAITTIGVAAYKTGEAIFALAKYASDYGSEFQDATEITGLSVETLGALRLAAEQGGKSFGDITSATEKFAKQLYAAKQGDEEAQKTMKALGVTSYDLETALGQAFEAIQKNTDGLDQMGTAQKAFGKTGAELLPIIKATGGGLDEYTEKAKKLGTTLTDEEVAAADEFGDALTLLDTQAKVFATRFALQYAPDITGKLESISEFIADNKEVAAEWGESVSQTFKGASDGLSVFGEIVNNVFDDFTFRLVSANDKAAILKETLKLLLTGPLGPAAYLYGKFAAQGREAGATIKAQETGGEALKMGVRDAGTSLEDAKKAADAQKRFREQLLQDREQLNQAILLGDKAKYDELLNKQKKFYQDSKLDAESFRNWFIQTDDEFVQKAKLNLGQQFDIKAKQEKTAKGREAVQAEYNNAYAQLERESQARRDEVEKLITERQKKDAENSIKNLEGQLNRRLSVLAAIAEKETTILEARRNREEISEIDFAKAVTDKKIAAIDAEIAVKRELFEAEEKGSEKRKQIVADLITLDLKRATAAVEGSTAITNALEKEVQKRQELLELELDEARRKREADQSSKLPGLAKPPSGEAKSKQKLSALGMANSRGEDFQAGEIFDENTIMTQVSLMETLKESGMDAFRSIAGEIGNAAAQWIAYSAATGQSLGEATKAILASVSAQALGTGLYELGIGFAALTPWGAAIYGPAPLHFKSAAILMGMGAAFGGLARAVPGGNGGQNSQQNSPDYLTSNQNNRQNSDFLRQNQSYVNPYIQQRNPQSEEMAAAINKLTAMKPGDVLTKGISEKRGFISETVTKELKSNSTAKNEMGRTLGLK